MSYNRREIYIPAKSLALLIGGAVLLFIIILGASQATHVVEPGHRGVRVTLGKVAPGFEQEGFVMKPPFITRIEDVSIRQQTEELKTEFYSSDLQQVRATMRILFRIPESSVVAIFQQYEGGAPEVLATLVAPRVIEALKEVASTQSAEMIVQNREVIKQQTLEATRQKIGNGPGGGPLVDIQDITLSDLALSAELNAAIEQKMTQQEEALRAKFVQRQAEIEAQTEIIRARGEGESIQIRGQALRENPAFIRLQIVEKWDGISPLMIGGQAESGPNVMVPMEQLEGAR